MDRSDPRREAYSRRVLVVSILLGVFVLFDLALFGWLIFRSLSRREVDRLLSETREEAESLAERIAGQAESQGSDLFTAVAAERETQTYIDQVLVQRDLVRTVEIRDREGRLVFQGLESASMPGQEGGVLPGLQSQEVAPELERKTIESESTYDLSVPIADLGNIYVGISAGEMARRVEVLRGDLMQQTTVIGAVTLAVLGLASLVIWWLLRRGRALEEQAMESERMAYIGTLASGLAHEIRSPLNSLNLNMQMLEEEAEASGSSRRLLAITRSEISRLERLATDFLAYARPRRLEIERVKTGPLLERVLEILAGEIQQSEAEVSISDRTGGLALQVDRGQIIQVLLNVTQNALAATEESKRPPEIHLWAERKGEQVVLGVRDNGIGIPVEELERITELFYSTRKGGTGLGLAIADRIARAHGGLLEIDSTPGRGTEVRLVFPASISAVAVVEATVSAS